MRSILLTFILTSLLSCGTEKSYFNKSITKNEKDFLSKNDSLVKNFAGQTNYKQYWTGKLLIRKTGSSYDVKQIGEWRQTSKNGHDLYAITNFDNFGHLQDEKIFTTDGTPDVETVCKKDTVDNSVMSICETVWRYADTKTVRLTSKSIIMDGKNYKHGTWQYFSKSGELEKTEEYKMDKKVK